MSFERHAMIHICNRPISDEPSKSLTVSCTYSEYLTRRATTNKTLTEKSEGANNNGQCRITCNIGYRTKALVKSNVLNNVKHENKIR